MNDFDWGIDIGRFFISCYTNEGFFGLNVRIGKEHATDADVDVYHITMQVGYLQLTIGIMGE